MALQTINLGTAVNDGTGDDLRTAFEKVVANFQYLNNQITVPVTAENLGVYASQGLFKEKTNTVLKFKSVAAGDNIEIQTTDDTLFISTTEGLDLKDFNIANVGNINIKGTLNLAPGSPGLFGPTSGVHVGIMQGTVYGPANSFGLQGDVVGRNPNVGYLSADYQPARIDGIAIKDLNRTLTSFDFGSLSTSYANPIQYLLAQIGIDLGTISSPTNISINFNL